MKLLTTIKSVELARKYQRQDGTFANIFGVTLEAGDDTIFAETFYTKELQERRGIKQNAVGTAILQFDLRFWTDRNGDKRTQQSIRLVDFSLANKTSLQSAQNSAGGIITHNEEENAAEAKNEGNVAIFDANAPF